MVNGFHVRNYYALQSLALDGWLLGLALHIAPVRFVALSHSLVAFPCPSFILSRSYDDAIACVHHAHERTDAP